jgi:hypothetical protein
LEFDGPPKGIFLITGETNASFPIIHTAPADADIIGEMNFNGLALFGIIRDVVIEVMGPMGQGIIDAQMNQPLIENGPTLADVINRLTTRMQVAVQFGPPPLEGVAITFNELIQRAALRVNNVADLLERFSPMLETSGLQRLAGKAGAWVFNIDTPELALSIYLQPIEGTNDLLVSVSESDMDWFLNNEAKLKDTPEFLKMVSGLPLQGTSFWYATRKASEFQIDTMDADFESNPQTDAIFVVLKNFLKQYTGPQIGVSFIEENSIRSVAYQPGSFKTNMAVSAVVVPAGILAGVMPMIQANMGAKAGDADAAETDPGSPPQ